MTVGDVLGEALDLYKRFFVRFVGTAAVVFVVLDLVSALADRAASSSSIGAGLLWVLIALVLSAVGSFWLQGALVEAVADVRDGRIDTTIGELYERTRPRLPSLIAAGIVAGIGIVFGLILLTRGHEWTVFGSLIVSFIAYAIVHGVLGVLFLPLPTFASIWIGGGVAHSVATPLIALTGAVLYFRLAPLSVGFAAEAPTPGT
jgi:hypothetical protein